MQGAKLQIASGYVVYTAIVKKNFPNV